MSAPWRETVAEALCASRDITDPHHEAQDVPCGPCWRDADALAPTIERLLIEARAGALREFAGTRGVNVGDEDDDWWKGYRQAQRECLYDAADAAARIARTAAQPATSTEEER